MDYKKYPVQDELVLWEEGVNREFLHSLVGGYALAEVRINNQSFIYSNNQERLIYYYERTYLSSEMDGNIVLYKTTSTNLVYYYDTDQIEVKTEMWHDVDNLKTLFIYLQMQWINDHCLHIIKEDSDLLKNVLKGEIRNPRQLIRSVLNKYNIQGQISIKKIIEHKIKIYDIRKIYLYFKTPDYFIHNFDKLEKFKQIYRGGSLKYLTKKWNAKWSAKRFETECAKVFKLVRIYEAFLSASLKQLIRYKLISPHYQALIPTQRN